MNFTALIVFSTVFAMNALQADPGHDHHGHDHHERAHQETSHHEHAHEHSQTHHEHHDVRTQVNKTPSVTHSQPRAEAPHRQQRESHGREQHHHENDARVARNVRDQIRHNRPEAHTWFNNQFFSQHHHRRFSHRRDVNWWRGAGWNSVSTWLQWGWSEPIYYYNDYDNYPEETIYPSEPPQVNEETAPEEAPEDEWLPLGVFAVGKNAEQATYSSLFVQLAVDKRGNIAGTYYNDATDRTSELQGTMDKQTQRVTWSLSSNPRSPRMTTNAFELTRDVANIQVHFPNGTVQNWAMVRMDQET